MRIEMMSPNDQMSLAEIHKQMGSRYPLPDFTGPMFIVSKVVKDDSGRIVGGSAIKIIGEAFLLLDPNLSPYQKTKVIKELSSSTAQACKEASLEEVSAWIPPSVEPVFAPLMHELGWIQSPWRSWSILL